MKFKDRKATTAFLDELKPFKVLGHRYLEQLQASLNYSPKLVIRTLFAGCPVTTDTKPKEPDKVEGWSGTYIYINDDYWQVHGTGGLGYLSQQMEKLYRFKLGTSAHMSSFDAIQPVKGTASIHYTGQEDASVAKDLRWNSIVTDVKHSDGRTLTIDDLDTGISVTWLVPTADTFNAVYMHNVDMYLHNMSHLGMVGYYQDNKGYYQTNGLTLVDDNMMVNGETYYFDRGLHIEGTRIVQGKLVAIGKPIELNVLYLNGEEANHLFMMNQSQGGMTPMSVDIKVLLIPNRDYQ